MNTYPIGPWNSVGKHLERHRRLAILVILFIAVGMTFGTAQAKSAAYKETDIKAALIYNFLKFVDWPKDAFQEDQKGKKEAIRIGVVGKDAFASAAKIFNNKKIHERSLKVIQVSEKHLKNEEMLRGFHVLYVSAAVKSQAKKIPPRLKNSTVLTIGEVDGFLEAGGIFNFVVEKKKIRFEVNLVAAEQAKIKIRSKLLRLAKRVIKPKPKTTKRARRYGDDRYTLAYHREGL